ncbi:MAG: LysR family transcriptional regulator [Lautropia sp.]
MNLDDLDYLAALWEHRNVGRAAQSLGLTQPAMSRALGRAEARLGIPLFERTPRGLVPTVAGEAFIGRMLRVRTELGDAMSEIDQLRSGRLGTVRVGYSPSIDESHVHSACRRLTTERPAARLTVVSRLMEDLAQRLVQGDLDLVVAPVPDPVIPDLDMQVLYRDRLRVVADRRHPLLGRPRVTLADIAAQSWMLQPVQFRVRRMLDERVAEAKLPPLQVRIESDVAALARLTLLCGTRMLALHVDREQAVFERLGLRALDVAGLQLDRHVALMRRKGGYVSPLSARLGELLMAQRPDASGGVKRGR